MLTKPASIPLQTTAGSNFLSRKKFRRMVVEPAVAAEMVVATPILAADFERDPPSPWVEPQLNPYQPNQSSNVPGAN